MNTKTALITGGSGYFGSLLIEKLLKKNYRCINFDIAEADNIDNKVEFIQGDIRNLNCVINACKNIDIVHHNVAQVPLAKNNFLFRSVNYEGVKNILKASLKNDVKKVIYTSSSAVFGVPKENPVTEFTEPSPAEDYGQAKYDGELLCKEYREKGLDISIIRPRTILGHGRLGIFQILFEWIYLGRNIPVFDGGHNIYQFVHADDLAEACILAGEKSGFNIFNCGTDNYGTMKEALEQLCLHAGTGSKVKSVPMKPAVLGMKIFSKLGLSPLGAYHALMYGKSMYFDLKKCKTELNWVPEKSNIDMFKDSYDWYVNNRELILSSKGRSHHKSPVREGILSLVSKLL